MRDRGCCRFSLHVLRANITKTRTYSDWFDRLRDAKSRITVRILRLALGRAGDARALGSCLYEIRVDHGPGYRMYLVHGSREIILLLCGVDEGCRHREIETARRLARDGREGA
ncbi:type II toxin-antitoxin system RelE/ParE family toxin [Rhizobium sp. G21]|uniref:type II toxin-antitoxin system RelE/ParE family toxin n=1 Tax=Rhizobium sp. G21 TaxID=2758439 RepID=UPI001600CBBF|nr:type II toxin-antitoxin system RelE/ParE family toxin [Rhizobium sp. G21]